MIYLGIDQSLMSTGLATVDHDGNIIDVETVVPPDVKGVRRLEFFYRYMTTVIQMRRVDLFAMEGYSYGGNNKGGRVFQLGELGGVLRVALFNANVRGIVVPPMTLKKFTTGSGKSEKGSKGIMIREVFRRYGAEVNNDDEADAVALAFMVRALDPDGDVPLASHQTEAPSKVEWLPKKRVRLRK